MIPTYWGRSKSEPLNLEDTVYDHPTPLDEEGTLERALDSLHTLKNRDFNVVIVAAATNVELEARVEQKVENIVSKFKEKVPMTTISYSFVDRIIARLWEEELSHMEDMVSLSGYSNIRNMCLIGAELADSEVVVLFDDDEVYEDPLYLDKVFEIIGRDFHGRFVGALAGFYIRPEGGYMIPPGKEWWMAEWPKIEAMNEAFSMIEGQPRLKETPFVFGGNMVIHRHLFRTIAFDPHVRRGEDIDYLINAKFFGYDFLLDNQLSIRHLPPESHIPAWQRFREDVYRFIYAREKLGNQRSLKELRYVEVGELDPYPGRFLGEDLNDMIFKTSILIGLKALESGDTLGFNESMRNIEVARRDALPAFNPFQWYLDWQKRWMDLMRFFSEDAILRAELQESISMS